ncbi:VOC family protein [Streptomyces sp. NPDC058642]|uniref:VOC family protein n=1 Tax=Streptomyces sp. NPDC058642 TaxID=3346572 RepID=UPI003646B733
MAVFGTVQVNLWCDDVAVRRRASPGRVEAAGVRIGFSSARVGRELFGIATTPGENTEVVLWCDDVDGVHQTALDAGGEPLKSPADSPDGRLRFSWLRDPEGHRVKLVQERG